MPLIPTIGRRQPKMRLLIGLLYTLLTLGAVTMVYPFVVMVGTSVTSPVDKNEFRDTVLNGSLLLAVPVELGGLGGNLQQVCHQQRRLARRAPDLAEHTSAHHAWCGAAASRPGGPRPPPAGCPPPAAARQRPRSWPGGWRSRRG